MREYEMIIEKKKMERERKREREIMLVIAELLKR